MPNAALNAFCAGCDDEIDDLVARFGDYECCTVDRPRLMRWLNHFNQQHWALAFKLLRHLKYYSNAQVSGLMPQLKQLLDQRLQGDDIPPQSVFYCPYGRSGESGNDIIRRFRNANRLHGQQAHFVNPSDLPRIANEEENPTIIFLDDFIGTGKQASDNWRELFSQLVPEYVPLYLGVVVAWNDGIDKVELETPLRVVNVHSLSGRDQLLSGMNRGLSGGEKNTVRRYCELAGNQPLGFGDLGLLLSFAYGTPNNSISVFRGSVGQKPWRGILPRWEDL